jgi:hypothetical protein
MTENGVELRAEWDWHVHRTGLNGSEKWAKFNTKRTAHIRITGQSRKDNSFAQHRSKFDARRASGGWMHDRSIEG